MIVLLGGMSGAGMAAKKLLAQAQVAGPGIAAGGGGAAVAQQLLDEAVVGPGLEQMDGAGVAHFTLVRAILHTGRTHQIRVHFAWLKHPVVGDTLYGYRKQRLALDRHFLHAHRLRLLLPGATEPREFTAPLPADLQTLLDQLDT